MPPPHLDDLLGRLYDARITCRLVAGKLRLQGPSEALQGSLLDELRRHKDDLTRLLQRQQERREEPLPQPKPADEPALLSFSQQRMWFFEQYEARGVPAYHIPCALRLRGRLQIDRLNNALSGIIARHQAMRTRFIQEDEEPCQVVDSPQPFRPALIDLSGLADPEPARAEIAAAEARLPFDLKLGPMYRGRLLRLALDDHVLLFTMHHIIFDGWSIDILVRELIAGYTGDRELPAPDRQYVDFSWWQRTRMNADVLHEQRDYWINRLADIPPLLELPTDKPRPVRQGFEGDVEPVSIEGERLAALENLAREHGATLFMTLQAILAVLLHRYTDREDIPVGTPIAGRTRPEWASLIGCFINTLCLRNDLGGNPSFARLLQRTRVLTLEAFANQDLPFEQVVDAVKPERNPGHGPLFQVMFALQNASGEALALPGLALDLLPLEHMPSPMDLTLQLTPRDDGCRGEWVYRTDLFEPPTIARISQHFLIICDAVCADPQIPVGSIDFLTAEDKQTLLSIDHQVNKLSHDKNRKPDSAAPMREHLPPTNQTERELADLWQGLLAIEPPGIYDSFFDLGGHSLMATRLAGRIRARFRVDLPVQTIFETPTIAGLAAAIQPLSEPGLPPVVPVESAADRPLSFNQQRFWFFDQLVGRGDLHAYNIPITLELNGLLNVVALEQALAGIIDRHETLRTRFPACEGRPAPIVMPPNRFSLPLIDLEGVDDVTPLIAREERHRFDLAGEDLFRAKLLRLGDRRHVLQATMHHIIADGWSMGVFVDELTTRYTFRLRQKTAVLPPLPVQYADYAAWQNRILEEGLLQNQERYWKDRLADAPPVLDVPLDAPRPAFQTFEGAYRRFHLDAADRKSTENLASETGATPFMVLHAAFCLLLSRYSGQTDLVTGTPVAGRNDEAVEPLIGLFINTLPLRLNLDGNPHFQGLVDRTRKSALEAFAHADLPFDRIAALADVPRDPAVSPVYQTLFALQNAPLRPLELPGLDLTPRDPQELPAAQDLTLNMWDEEDGYRGYLIANRGLFKPATVDRMVLHFQNLLRSALAEPRRDVFTLPLMSGEEQALLQTFNRGEPVSPELIHEKIARQATLQPDAVVFSQVDGRCLTFGELARRAGRLAAILRERGVGRESIVGAFLHRGLDLTVAQLAVWQSGAAILPLDPNLPIGRAVWTLDDAGANLLLTSTDLIEGLDFSLSLCVDLPDAFAGRALESEPMGADEIAYVIYTSGSTGQPKGVSNTHAGLTRLTADANITRVDPKDHVLQVASCAFDAYLWETWCAAMGGARVTFYPKRYLEPAALAPIIAEHKITRIFMVPANLDLIMDEAPDLLGDIRFLSIGADALKSETVKRVLTALPDVILNNAYGPTECGVLATSQHMSPNGDDGPIAAVGRTLPGTETHILDRNFMPVPMGVPGELCLGGPGLARDYHRRPALTARQFVPHPFAARPGERLYRTGDLIKLVADDDGRPDRFIFLGRIDHQVKLRGYRIELGEVENALLDLPSVRRAAVTLRRNPDTLVAHLVPQPNAEPAGSQLAEQLADRLPDYMIPAVWDIMEALPLSANGKIDRKALQARTIGFPRRQPEQSPQTELQKAIARVWCDVLDVAEVGLHTDFFEAGGYSLAATRVVARLRDVLDVDLETRDLFARPTVAALAELVERGRNRAVGIPRLSPGRTPGLSFAQTRLWFLDRLEHGKNPAYNMAMFRRLRGRPDANALERAFRHIAGRHDVMMSAMPKCEDGPSLLIDRSLSPRLQVVDLEHLDPKTAERSARSMIEAEQIRPFNLETGPLVRIYLLRLAFDHHFLLVNLHHIIGDGLSVNILASELSICYNAFTRGRNPEHLKPLPVTYADYAAWQRQYLESGALNPQLDYWLQKLALPLPFIDLPILAGVDSTDARGAVQTLALSAELGIALRRLAAAQGTTLFTVLLAAFKIVLQRWSGQDDIVVGTPVAGRNQSSLEPLIGLFLNSLALRDDLSGRPTFLELLARVRETTHRAFANQDVPFERLVEAVNPNRRLDRHPFYDVVLNLVESPGELPPLAGLESHELIAEAPPSKMFLSLSVEDRGDALILRPIYRKALFQGEQIAAMLGRFKFLLEQITANPEQPIDTYSTLNPEALSLVPDPTRPLIRPPSGSIVGSVFRLALDEPDRPAVITDTRHYGYGRLAEGAATIARLLRQRGQRKGDVVAVYGRRDFGMATALTAVFINDGIILALDPDLPEQRRRTMLDLADPRFLIVVNDSLGDWAGEEPVFVDGETGLPPGVPKEPVSMPDITEGGGYIVFTSGTTGRPKGVLCARSGLEQYLHWERSTFKIGAGDRVAQLSTLSVDMPVRDFFLPLLSGAAICMPPNGRTPEPGETAAWLNRQQITIVHSVASISATWLTEGVTFPHLRLLFLTGELLRDDVVCRWQARFSGKILNIYGASETCFSRTWHAVPSPPPCGIQAVGRPLPGGRVLVLDGQRQCGLDEVGEIYLELPFPSKGYLKLPEETALRYPDHPFREFDGCSIYRTGDLGRLAPDGKLHLSGRMDRQVKILGVRIEPGEIEAVFEMHPDVHETAVAVLPNEWGETRLAAFVATGENELKDDLRAFLLQRLPTAMIPAVIRTMPALPRLTSGKPDRRALLASLDQRENHFFAPPRSQAERELAALWEDILGCRVDHIGRDFFELGGHSLSAVQVQAGIRQTMGVELSVRDLFEHPTLGALAARIDETTGAESGPLTPMARPEFPPLSFSQHQLWFLHRLAPDDVAYNMAYAVHFKGRLDIRALQVSLNEIISRHEILRTIFAEHEGKPYQSVQPDRPRNLSVIDLRGVDTEAATATLAEQEARRPFDLTAGPLLCIGLLRLTDKHHLLLMTMHHIIADGWSLSIFVSEMTQAYRAALRGTPALLPDLPLQYVDLALWQQQRTADGEFKHMLDWWRDQLSETPQILSLPLDRPRNTPATGRGGMQPLRLSRECSEAVERLARKHGATPYMILLAVYAELLRRFTGMDHFLIGAATANRGRREFEPLIGYFVNTLALPVDFRKDVRSADRLIDQVRNRVLDAFAHGETPLEHVVEAVVTERAPGVSPLIQTLFLLQNTPMEPMQLPGLELQPAEQTPPGAKLDLALILSKEGGCFQGVINYADYLFEAATVARMAGHYQNLAEAFADTVERSETNLTLLGRDQRETSEITALWNHNTRSYPKDLGLHQCVAARAAERPDAIALCYRAGDTRQDITYGALLDHTNRLAAKLRGLGIEPGDLVGIYLPRSPETIAAVLAVMHAGAAYVPLPLGQPEARPAFTAADAGLSLIISNEPAETLWNVPNTDARPGDEVLPQTDKGQGGNRPAYVIYTSGSTGKPKGALLGHGGVLSMILAAIELIRTGPESRMLQRASLAFDASVWEIFTALCSGARLYLMPDEEMLPGDDLCERLTEERITHYCSIPSALAVMPRVRLPYLKYICFGGESCPEELAEFWSRHQTLINAYGPTEASVTVTTLKCDRFDRPLAIGRPIPNMRVHILAADLMPTPAGVPGQLYLAGVGLAHGYLNRPGLTAERFIPNPFAQEPGERLYATGDLGRCRWGADGPEQIEFLGRVDHQIKLRGFRIEPGEVEAALSDQPGVSGAVVLIKKDPSGSRHLVAYITTEDGDAPPNWSDALKDRLPDYMIPTAVIAMKCFPLTPNGKLDRKALPEPRWDSSADYLAPETETEKMLASLWGELLKRDTVGAGDNFFELGGHSLTATRLVSGIRDALNLEIPMRLVFELKTLRELGAAIDDLVLVAGLKDAPESEGDGYEELEI
ncbi:MAG: amino acid adenylation domain-containing protein [Acidobacteriota bacterium]|nr:amino acid adenylation domain-containing protein [Acidobacteriota bacterium]